MEHVFHVAPMACHNIGIVYLNNVLLPVIIIMVIYANKLEVYFVQIIMKVNAQILHVHTRNLVPPFAF